MPKGQQLFTPKQAMWLVTLYPKYGGAETTRLLNARFGTSFTVRQVNAGARNRKAGPSPVDGRINPGDPRCGGNGAALVKAGNATRFKKGSVPGNVVPLYSERWSANHKTRRYREIKVPGPTHKPSLQKLGTEFAGHWVGKAKWVWEQANGPVPEGHVIAVMDGDEANCAIENLECVPRSVMARRNAYHAPRPAAGDKDAYKATIRIAQIKDAIATR